MQEQENYTQQEWFPFDPITVVRSVLKRWYLIVAAAILLGTAAYIYKDCTYRPNYTSKATFVVSVRSSTGTVYQNLTATSNLAAVFTEVLNSSILKSTILEELGMTEFNGTIKASVVPDTNLLTLQVSDANARTAFLVTRSIIENHSVVTEQVLGDTILEVLQEPRIPTAPSNFRDSEAFAKKAILLAAAVTCVLLAILAYIRDSVRSRREAEEKLDCSCIGEIRHERRYKTFQSFLRRQKNPILITRPATSFLFVESLRKLRRRVENQLKDGKKVLLVTSVLPNEGKSTVSVNLALSLAVKGRKVLLVDCDLRKPTCYKLLEKPARGSGTIDVINGDQPLSQAVIKDKPSGLHMLLEYKRIGSATNLLDSERMAKLLEDARQIYDIIVVDSPPVSAAPDAETLMKFVDGALLVVRQDAALTKTINQTLHTLSRRAEVFGCVLNDVYSSSLLGGSGYGHRYGYGYGRYGRYGKYGGYSYGKYGRHGKFEVQNSENAESAADV